MRRAGDAQSAYLRLLWPFVWMARPFSHVADDCRGSAGWDASDHWGRKVGGLSQHLAASQSGVFSKCLAECGRCAAGAGRFAPFGRFEQDPRVTNAVLSEMATSDLVIVMRDFPREAS